MTPVPIANSIAALRESLAVWRGAPIALVAPGGALPPAHLSLVRPARQCAAHVVVSIFVNPTQFAPHEDFDSYPRTLDADLAKLSGVGTQNLIVFAPSAREMYP